MNCALLTINKIRTKFEKSVKKKKIILMANNTLAEGFEAGGEDAFPSQQRGECQAQHD